MGTGMWVAAIDFKKAFNSIQHDAGLEISPKLFGQWQYICLVKKLYTDQRATILTDVESDEFRIARGTKQGDPLGSLLFQLVLQSAGLGIKLSDEKETACPTYVLLTTCS